MNAQSNQQNAKKTAEADVWLWNSDGARLFSKGEEIPHGYVDSPAKLKDSK